MRTSFATISKQGARSNNEDYLLVMDKMCERDGNDNYSAILIELA